MDRLITGLVVGGAIASIFGLSKKKKEGIASKVGGVGKTVFLTGLGIFGKTLAKGVSLFSKKK